MARKFVADSTTTPIPAGCQLWADEQCRTCKGSGYSGKDLCKCVEIRAVPAAASAAKPIHRKGASR